MIPEEAIQLIRETWGSNSGYLDDLKERSSSRSSLPIVPFVGAGISMGMGFPSWGGFLRQLAKEGGTVAEVERLLAGEQYEAAAEAAEGGLGAEIFNDRVRHIFGTRSSAAQPLKGAVLALPGLTTGPVVTTNFDGILERAFKDAGRTFARVVWGSQVDSLREAIADNKPFLLKIHGDAEERTGRVLTKSEYDQHYGSKKRTTKDRDGLRAQLKRIFSGRTLLFVGCSLGADRTMDVMYSTLLEAAGLKHYAILSRPEGDEALAERARWLGARAIRPIWYPPGRHDLVEPMLRWLAPEVGRRAAGVGDEGVMPASIPAGATADGLDESDDGAGPEHTLTKSKRIQILISQHFRIADLLTRPENVRPTDFVACIQDTGKMRRAVNERKKFRIGKLGQLKAAAAKTDEGYVYWRESVPEFRGAKQGLWFLPFELGLTDYLRREHYDGPTVLKQIFGDGEARIVNPQLGCRLRIYPPGVGVIRVTITLSFRDAVVAEMVTRIAQELESTFFVRPDGKETTFPGVVIGIIDEVAEALFLDQQTSEPERRWRPPETTFYVYDDEGFVPKDNVRSLAFLLSEVPENHEERGFLETRLRSALNARSWQRSRLIAFASQRSALLFGQAGANELQEKKRERAIHALLETQEVVAAGAYCERALVEQLSSMKAARFLDSVGRDEMEAEIQSLFVLARTLKMVLQAVAAARLTLPKHGSDVLVTFAQEIWLHSYPATTEDMKAGLTYVREWCGRNETVQAHRLREDLLNTLHEIETLSEPF